MFEHIPPKAYVTVVLAFFSYVAVIGGILAVIGATIRILVLRRLPIRLSRNSPEKRLLLASVVASLLGSAWLFLAPAYGGYACALFSSTTASPPTITASRRTEIGPNGEQIEVVEVTSTSAVVPVERSNCPASSKTFYEVNGLGVIPLFTIPIAFTLVPFAFYALRIRPIIQGAMGLLLGAQILIGMSLYGAAFGPSGVLMVLAALAALRTNTAQPGVGAFNNEGEA